MDWDDLRFVLALSREGSLTLAAKTLGVTHTTVARRIKAFEATLGSRVVNKTPEGYLVTPAGREIVAVAERMEEQMLSLDRTVAGRDADLRGRVRLATMDSFAIHNAEVFEGFGRAYPGISLEVTVATDFVSLTRREADVALRWTNSPPPHLVGRKMGRYEYALYGARSLIERMGPETSLEDYPWVNWDPRLGARMTERWLKANVPNAHTALYVDSGAVMLTALKAGVGLAFFVCFEGDVDDQLVRIQPIQPGWGMDVWLLTHPDLRRAARIRAVMDYFAAALEPLKGRMAGDLGVDPDPVPRLTAEG